MGTGDEHVTNEVWVSSDAEVTHTKHRHTALNTTRLEGEDFSVSNHRAVKANLDMSIHVSK